MNKPEVVVFDLGKVLLDFDYTPAADGLARLSRLNAQEVHRLFETAPWLLAYESGQLSTKEFFAHIRDATGFSGSLADFGHFFADIFTPIDLMIELHRQLRVARVPTYIFSNTNELAIEHIRRHFPFFRDFDGYILSYEHGVMKPQPGLYEVVEEQSGRRGAQILYLDDRIENVQAGAARGWRAFLQESPDKTWQHVRQVGLL